jgi:alkaline phosphatase
VRFLPSSLSFPRVFAGLACTLFPWLLIPSGSIAQSAGEDKVPKNIIVMIGDGYGYNQLEAGRCYQYGETGRPEYHTFTRFAMSTYPAEEGAGYDPGKAWDGLEYIRSGATDSAASATAMACGVKTLNGSVGKDAEGNDVPNVTETADKAGRATGVVTSVMFSHATPACFVTHAPQRGNTQQIAERMIVGSSVDVIMGAGHPLYDASGVLQATPDGLQYVGGPVTWDLLQKGEAGGDADGDGEPDRWTLVDTREGFQRLMSGEAPKRVLGVAPTRTTLQLERPGDPQAPAFAVPFNPNVPTLSEMAMGAINVLEEDPQGFLLMIEGGAIDWAGHANLSGRLIEEVIDFNKTIDSVVEWIESHGGWEENLLVITADHETGQLTGPGADPEFTPVVCQGKGEMPGMEWHITKHTNSLVPFHVKGAGSEKFASLADETDPVRGAYLDNAEMGKALMELAGRLPEGK